MNLKLLRISDLEERGRQQLEAFNRVEENGGEFINSPLYLSYHIPGRFQDDSILVYDIDCGEIRGSLMAAKDPQNPNKIISHPGTTFAGPVISQKRSIQDRQLLLEMLLNYYETKYNEIELRTRPSIYSRQPDELTEFLLLKRGYRQEAASLSNVIRLDGLKKNDVFMLYKTKRRNHVNKSIKEELFQFREERNVDASIWSSLSDNLKAKFQTCPTHSLDEIQHLKDMFPEEIRSYSVYRKTGEYGAFALVYHFKQVCHTQYLDMNYQLSSEYPNLFLIHHLIQTAIENNFSYFSFGASTESGGASINQGLFTYKAEFGGGEIILPKFVKNLIGS